MPNLPKGTIVAEAACSCCGKPVDVKLNVNGNAYYFCTWSDDRGNPCSHHERWGKASSQQLQRNYLDARKQSKSQLDEVTTHEPSPAPQEPKTPTPDGSEASGISEPEKSDGGGGFFDAFA